MYKFKFEYILIIFFLMLIGIIIYKVFIKKKYISYDENKLFELDNKKPLYMYIPLNKLNFSQSQVSNKMGDDEDLNKYSKKIKEYYLKTGKISFLNRDPPRAIYWKKTNTIQLLDNRRAVAAIKIFCPNCSYTYELPNNIFIPLRIYDPDCELEEKYRSKYQPTICFKSKSFCDSIGKFRKPNTYGEAVIFRSINSYNNYNLNTTTNSIPIFYNYNKNKI